jgi:hypothetical protein
MMPAYAGPHEVELEPDKAQTARQFDEWFTDVGNGHLDIGWTDTKTGALTHFSRYPLTKREEAVDFIYEINRQPGQSVYWRPAIIRPEAPKFVTDTDFKMSPGNWADFDDEGAAGKVKTIEPMMRPTMVVVTGRHPWTRAQMYWRHKDLIGAERTRGINATIAERLQGDPAVINPTSLMRVAGSIAWPWKEGRVPEMAELVEFQDERRRHYQTGEIVQAFPPAEATAPTNGAASPSAPAQGDRLALGTGSRLDVHSVLDSALQPGQWHNSVIALVAHWINRGLSNDEIVLMCRNLTMAGYTTADTDREVLKAIEGARAKWGIGNPAHEIGPQTEGAPIPLEALPLGIVDEKAIPRRRWILEDRLIRKFVSLTIAPGGVGKSTLTMQEAIAIATGRALTGSKVEERGKVWVWNLEDPRDELMRRMAAVLKHWGIPAADVADRVFLNSGLDRELIVVQPDAKGNAVATPDVEALVTEVKTKGVDVLIVDPFVRAHRVNENVNAEIDLAVKAFSRVAQLAECAVMLVHHSRKRAGGETIDPGDADMARGASSLVAAVRVAHALSTMSKKDAEALGVEAERRRWYARLDNAKANMHAPAETTAWFEHKSVMLANGGITGDGGDSVGVLTPWTPPEINSLSAADARDVVAELGKQWTAGTPFSRSSNSERAIVKWMTKRYPGLGKQYAKELVDSWIETGYVAEETFDKHRKRKGLKQLKGLES